MNHNFADWEITQLLPKNPYLEYDSTSWTWEDIRLYLAEKGYIINVISDNNGIFFQYYYIEKTKIGDMIKINIERSSNDYSTYEKARKECIIQCLNLINNEQSNKS